jgi:dTDP-4-dehydrorhamnose 3,5-epimerase
MNIEGTDIPGCYVVQPRLLRDARGSFVKTFHAPRFAELGLRTDWKEEYYSSSTAGVVRGMHFQTPPADHAKLVFCLAGDVFDVVVDLRRGSPVFGQARGFSINAENGRGVYVPAGCAHGFASLAAESVMYYKVTSVHAPDNDAGIAWDSIGIDWPVREAALSERDRQHPRLDAFETPFVFDPGLPGR